MADLVITNGDSAAELLCLAGRDGRILPWRDVLHEGPITETELTACSRLRARHLARRFRTAAAEVTDEFAARDATIRTHRQCRAIELWFEHDLYDQLQLVQVLAFFAAEGRSDGLTLVQADDFLGAQRPDTILKFAERARPVGQADLHIAAAIWADLAAPSPEPIARRVASLDDRLPFMAPALRRFLEELPGPANGLNRTEQAILDAIANRTTSPADLFRAVIAGEPAAFMGDWSFYRLLDDLASCDVPLIAGLAPPGASDAAAERFEEAALGLTMAGDDVVSGGEDHVALSGLDRWWAGTRLHGRAVWRYDRDTMKLVPSPDSGA